MANEIQFKSLKNAAELACGYGRVIPVLTEFSSKTYGFEREDNLIGIARKYIRDVEFHQFSDIAEFNTEIPTVQFDLLMVSAVMQHLTNQYCKKVAFRISNFVKFGGYLLLIENIDNDNIGLEDSVESEMKFLSKPRGREFYINLFNDLDLISESQRQLEKSIEYDAGRLSLF